MEPMTPEREAEIRELADYLKVRPHVAVAHAGALRDILAELDRVRAELSVCARNAHTAEAAMRDATEWRVGEPPVSEYSPLVIAPELAEISNGDPRAIAIYQGDHWEAAPYFDDQDCWGPLRPVKIIRWLPLPKVTT